MVRKNQRTLTVRDVFDCRLIEAHEHADAVIEIAKENHRIRLVLDNVYVRALAIALHEVMKKRAEQLEAMRRSVREGSW